MVTKRQNRKDHIVSDFFIIYSSFTKRNQTTLFSRKFHYNDWEKGWGAHARWWATAIFSTDRPQCQGNSAMFSVCSCSGEGALNEAINNAQKGSAMRCEESPWSQKFIESKIGLLFLLKMMKCFTKLAELINQPIWGVFEVDVERTNLTHISAIPLTPSHFSADATKTKTACHWIIVFRCYALLY